MVERASSVQALAAEAAACFLSVLRDESDSDSGFVRLRDGSPEWVSDLVYDAHGGFGRDDWRYGCIRSAVDWLSDEGNGDDAGEFADSEVDVYTGRRLEWLASNLSRVGYCDEAAAEFGGSDTASDIVGMVGAGQYMEASEVFGLVLAFLEGRADA